jgi:hypothetical protein
MSAGICNSPKTTKPKNKLYRNSRLPEITTSHPACQFSCGAGISALFHDWLSGNVRHASAIPSAPRIIGDWKGNCQEKSQRIKEAFIKTALAQ